MARRVVAAVVVALLVTAFALDRVGDEGGEGEPPESAEPTPPLSVEPKGERLAVMWSSIRLSEDRRTVTVTTSYPREGFCVKEADGVDVEVRGDTAMVAAWMRGPEPVPSEGAVCTTECGFVTQSVTLPEPLSERVAGFEPVDHAVPGCA